MGRDQLAWSDVIVVHRLLKRAGATAARGTGSRCSQPRPWRPWGSIRPRSELVEAEESIERLRRVSTFTLDLEARYGTMTVDGEEFGIHFVLEALVDGSTGVGTAEGRWTLVDPSDRDVLGRGELLATVTGDLPTEPTPPDPDLELHGMLIGLATPPDPDMPSERLLGNFSGSLRDEALNFSVGDPTTRARSHARSARSGRTGCRG